MYMKGKSPLGDINYLLRSIGLVARSQFGYELRQADAKLKNRLIKAVVQGGNVVTPGANRKPEEHVTKSPLSATFFASPMDAFERMKTVTAGMESFAKLISSGVYPGFGGYEVDPSTNEKLTSQGSPFKVFYGNSKASAKSKASGDGLTQEKEEFLIKAAKEVEVVLPEKSDSKDERNQENVFVTKESVAYRPVVPKDYRLEVVPKSTMNLSKERSVPRVANFGFLAVGLGGGAVAEIARRTLGMNQKFSDSTMKKVVSPSTNPFLTEANAERIVETLCRVRGAALKLGQMLSMQDEETVPSYLLQIFERVRQNADFMPIYQVRRQLEKELGSNWRELFLEFDEKPFAAASIGQVHKATALDGKELAVKIQYPGVSSSIDSDINNLISVLSIGNLFPKGLFLENLVSVIRRELKLECDYEREAKAMDIFRQLLQSEPDYYVPKVYPELSTKRILTGEYVEGNSIDSCVTEPQAVRDYIASKYVELCMKELFVWRFMQTDPNWSNFLFGKNPETGKPCLLLLDFGASRSYKKVFVDHYMRIIKAIYDNDVDKILQYSRDIGFLTNFESKEMEQAHVDSTTIMGEVLASRTPYDFAAQNVTSRVVPLIPVMLEHRLTPPPDEIYSLHRKISGSHLIATRLKAVVSCGAFFDEIYQQYKFGEETEKRTPLDPIFAED